MISYKVQGLDGDGRFVTIELAASNAQEAERMGVDYGLQVLGVKSSGQNWSKLKLMAGKFSLLLFNQELLALLEAGLSIVEVLETLLEKETNANTRYILKAIVTTLHEGRTLSAALESQPLAFPALYVATIRSSERTGSLIESLRRYIAYQMQVDQMRKKIIAASIYPALLMFVGGLVVLFLLMYVIPKFSRIYADTGHELPLASWLLMRWGAIIESHGSLVAGVSFSVLFFIIYALSRASVRGWIRELLWRLPVVGERMRIYQLSRFYRTLGMLSSAGIPLMMALEQVAGLLDIRLQSKLTEARNHVREGRSLSHAMELSGLSTAVALRLLRVGEQTGQMGGMMDRIADFHEEELNRWIDWASRLFEPLLMTAIGIIIGGIVVLMYVPIFELAGSIQ
ncbi:MAG: type II secretion system F family protein [Methylovulum sp.]|nr:type II secretion system F family protein [Methylovulum sp.]